jgi:hypothetical protein
MMESETGKRPLTAEDVIALARAMGVELGDERAAALVAQAEPHFGLMRAIDRIDPRGAEPAGEFRLDRWEGANNG